MDTTTADTNGESGVQSEAVEPGSEAAFENLIRGGLEGWEEQREQPQTQQEGAQQAKPQEGAETATDKQEAQGEPETKEYASLDEYLKDSKLEPESFMSLPVTVKVDGEERSVPLAELQKSYQLSSASYNRMQELATEKTSFETERTQVRQALGTRIQQVEGLLKNAQDVVLADFDQLMKSPQWAQMEPGARAEVMLGYQQRQTQIQQYLQQLGQAKQQQDLDAQKTRQQSLAAEQTKLLTARPEWRDSQKLADAMRSIGAAGRKLGFTDAELQSITDHRELILLDLAAKQLQLQAKAPATVNRVRTAPQMAKPGTRQVRDPKAVAHDQAQERWARSGYRDDDAAVAVFERFV